MNYRKASEKDIPQLVALRVKQLMDEGLTPINDITHELLVYFKASLNNGSFISWIAEEDGIIIATSGICLYQLPPSFSSPSGMTAYLANMYTEPSYRKRGIASDLLKLIADEARKQGYMVIRLHASKQGRTVYERFGFRDLENYMAMNL